MHFLRPEQFELDDEAAYRLSRTPGAQNVARIASVFAAFLFLSLGAWDNLIDPGSFSEAWPYRIATAAAFGALFLTVWRRRWSLPAVHVLLGIGFLIATVGFALVVAVIEDGYIAGVPGFIVAMSAITVGPATHRALLGTLAIAAGVPVVVYAVTGAEAIEIQNLVLWLGSGAGFVYAAWRVTDHARRRVFLVERALEAERDKVDALVRKMVPGPIADRLKAGEEDISDRHDEVTVLFADLVGFTRYAESHQPEHVVGLLNLLFSRFDDLVAERGLEKIKTLGDGYMVAAGAPTPVAGHASAMVELGRAMRAALAEFDRQNDLDWQIRIGIHTGAVVAGVIGSDRYAYDMWGDTVNVASRLESTGEGGEIHLSAETAAHLSDVDLAHLGPVELKNREPIEAYRVIG